MDPRKALSVGIPVLALVAFALAFQGSRGLWEPDEGRYTDIAAQMLRSGNYVEPAWNHEFSHFAKPPLTYWAVAAGIELLGRNEWGARVPNAVAYALTVLLVYGLGRRLTPGRPWLPPLVYAAAVLPYLGASIITTDTLLTLWESLAMLGFLRWHTREEGRSGLSWLLVMWGGFALAFLTKGPPGILPLLALMAFLAMTADRAALRGLFDPRGIIVFAVIGLSWYAVVLARRPELLRYFLVDEVVKRIASGDHQRNAVWYGAVKIYAPALLVGFLPWTPWLVGSLPALGNSIRPAWWRAEAAERPLRLLAILWFLVPLAVFVASQSRLPLYVLPLFVPLSLLLAARWEHRPMPGRAARVALALWFALLAGGRWATSWVASPQDSRPLAKAIAALPGAPPTEVVFVEARPSWALSLYLDTEVERIYLMRSLPGQGQSFDEELAEKEPSQLFVVRDGHVTEFTKLAESRGQSVARIGGLADQSFLRLLPASSAGRQAAVGAEPGADVPP